MKNALKVTFQLGENTPTTAIETETVMFAGCFDKNGRAVGAQVKTWEAAGYFAAYCHGTRDGVTFGPTQRRHYFATEADRAAGIEDHINKAAKRAAKM